MLAVNTTFESALIGALAREAAGRCGGPGAFDAISAIILSYAAFEAFVNEFAQLAQTTVFEAKQPPGHPARREHPQELLAVLRPFVFAIRTALECRASTEYRYDLSWEAFAGAPPSKGQGVRQRLSALTKLRNDLVHIKAVQTQIEMEATPAPEGFDGFWAGQVVERHEEPKYFASLRTWGLMDNDVQERWVHRISSRKIADWACATATSAACELVSTTPRGSSFRERLEERSLAGG